MKFGLCPLPVIPVRKIDSDKSEMVSQLVLGETFSIITEKSGWLKIITDFDKYVGWIDSKQILVLDESSYKKINNHPVYYSGTIISLVKNGNYNDLIVPMGARLPFYKKNQFKIGNEIYSYNYKITKPEKRKINQRIEIARSLLNVPYLWGGKTPLGLDCSGFIQLVFKLCAVNLPRDAGQQEKVGKKISYFKNAQPGDLFYFNNNKNKIVHVGMMIEDSKIIHCSGRVRIDKITKKGIYNMEEKKYTHKIHSIKRII